MSTSIHQVQHGQAVLEPMPLFLFPGMGGYDPQLVEIGTACGDAVTSVEIAYPAWRVLYEANDFDLDTLVSDVVGQITRHCPACAILLAGYSFGGIVAFAAATRLRDLGYTVRLLGLLDVEAHPGIGTGPGAFRAPKTLRQQLVGFSAAVRRGEGRSKFAYAIARYLKSPRWKLLLRAYARVPPRWLTGKFRIYLERDLLSEHMEPLLRQWVARRGTVRSLPVPTYLFRTEQHSGTAAQHLGWDYYCPDLTVVPIPGSHLGMLGSSNRPILCAAFRDAVLQVLGRPTPD